MAAAGTVLQLQDIVIDDRRVHFLVRPLFEITGVTAGAVRLICRKLPGNHFVIICMAGTARYPSSVRFIIGRRMHVGCHRRPSRRVSMALVARLCRNKMAPGLPYGQ